MDSDTDSFHSASDGEGVEDAEDAEDIVVNKGVEIKDIKDIKVIEDVEVVKGDEEAEDVEAKNVVAKGRKEAEQKVVLPTTVTLPSPPSPNQSAAIHSTTLIAEQPPIATAPSPSPLQQCVSEDAIARPAKLPPSKSVPKEVAPIEEPPVAEDDEGTGWDVDDWDEGEADQLKTPDEEMAPSLSAKSTAAPRQTTTQPIRNRDDRGPSTLQKNNEDDWFENQLGGDAENKPDRPNSLWEWGSFKGIVSAVGEGFSNVLESVETGLGAPTPEALARLSLAEKEALSKKVDMVKEPWPATDHDDCDSATDEALSDVGSEVGGIPNEDQCSSGYQSDSRSRDLDASQALSSLTGGVAGTASGLTGLFTGVGKSLVSGSLDVLETLGKKTFETLTVSEQGAKGKPGKRRLIFQKERPNLSKVLRELKTQVDVDAKSQQEEEEARLANFVYLFEKNEGMVHLEGLEMLSESCSRQVESALISGIDQETLDQLDVVRDMYDGLTDEESLSETADVAFESEIKNYLKRIGLAYNPAKLLETDKRLFDWLYDCQTTQDLGEMKEPRDLHRQAIRSLAEFAARCVETLHKLAQLMLVAGSAPEAKPFFDLTLVFCAEIGVIAAKFSTCLNSAADDVDDPSSVSAYLTSLFLEANNSTNYLREALRLLRPVLERTIILERNTSVA